MCNNVFKWFLRAFAVVAALTVISCADSPDEDDIVIPQCSLSVDGTTVEQGGAATMTFDETGGTKQFSIKTTGEWEISGLENAPQSFALTTSKGEEKYTGKGDETFTVTLGESTASSDFLMTVKVYASIFGQQKVADTKKIRIVQTKGGALPEGKVIYNNNFDKEKATQTFGNSGDRWPYLDQFEGWKNQEGEGAAEVTYDFKSVSARSNSASDSKYSNYAGSGVNNILFSGGGYLTIQNIAVPSTNLCLTFGTERYVNDENDNTFKNEEFLVTLSADGQSWSAPIAYAFEDGVDTNGKWNVATADFTLPDGTTKLYVKFASTLSGAHRIDDVKLTDGIGGQAITFEGGGDTPTPPTPGGATTVADLVAKCKAAGSTQTPLDEANDVVVEAVVVTDKDGGNTNSKNLVIMAEGATGAGNGVMLYGSGSLTDPADPSFAWKSGDKVRVTLKAGQARACIFNGTYEITGSTGADWIAIEKIGTATITPVELTSVDNLAEYQSMVVKIKDATSPATAAEWCTASAFKTHTFTVGGSNLTVYVQKNAAAFVGKQFKASTTGDITGVVTVYKNNPQLAPRTADDVKAFNGEGGGDEPTPSTPAESGTITMSAADIIANGTTTITENNYGSQNVNDASTYYTWKMNDVTFAGAKICKATNENYAGLIQMQGNATDKAKQGFFGNTVDLKKITKVVIVSKNTTYEPTEHLYVGTSAYPLGQNAVTRADMKQDGQTYTETFNISGDYGYFVVANDKQGAFYVESVTVYYGEDSGSGGDQPDPGSSGNTATLTLADITAVVGSYNNGYKDTTINAADGSVWTGFVAGNETRLQLGWNTTPTKSAAKSYLLVPNADKVIKKITLTPEGGTIDNRVLVLLPADFEYTGQSADEVKTTAYACSASTVSGSTEPLTIDLTGKNLKRFMIRAVGGAVYLTNIAIEYE